MDPLWILKVSSVHFSHNLGKTLIAFSRRKPGVDLFWGTEQWFCLILLLFFPKNVAMLMTLFALEMSEQRSAISECV